MKITDFTAYFEQIAKDLIDIGHDAPDKHFSSILSSELLNGMKSKINSRVLVIDKYEVKWIHQQGASLKRIYGGFSIMKKVEKGNVKAEEQAMLWSETLLEQVLSKMISHKEQGYDMMRFFKINDCEMFPLSNVPMGYFGMGCEVYWEIPYTLCMNPSYWSNTQNNSL
jgi:hypothetical protein